MLVNDIRNLFLNYFIKNNHSEVKSSSLIPNNDDTLLFTNSGMVQFKNVFTGLEKRPYTTATTVQKCIRAGGKHNDLDNVGYTARHHTFFEMLGNFSFGSYFKEQAITLAWNFLTKELNLPKDRLLVTVYHTDDEAYNLWKSIAGLPDDKIIRISTNDNFWSMGDTGPCGPCSEIFYDYGSSVAGGPPGSLEQDGDRFVEIWNLVFMQYEKLKDGSLINLKQQSIDTGMGLERLASVVQGKLDNYDTDIFITIMQSISEHLKVKQTLSNKTDFKVIADHLRSIAFLISEDVLPSNEGRGYVLRRIIRRAIRYSYFLGSKEPVLYKIISSVINSMGSYYTQLQTKQSSIIEILKQEESKFLETFEKGLNLLNIETKSLKTNDVFDGKIAFKLYDTFGFPIDLTENILKQRNITVNKDEFNKAQENHKELAKKSWSGSGENKDDAVWFEIAQNHSATIFNGYEELSLNASVIALLNSNLQEVALLKEGEEGWIILDKTPFYATMGGQVGDCGVISNNNFTAEVSVAQKKQNDITAHKCIIKNGTIKLNDVALASINTQYRNSTTKHHTVAHLLQASLLNHLGSHISQQGSMVNNERMRFDFSHNKALTTEEIKNIENEINNVIARNLEVKIEFMSPKTAIERGALALFSEKYPDNARTVKIADDKFISFELCGGTHVKNTAEIGVFKIISEGSIASGVRRVEAVCGTEAIKHYNTLENTLNLVAKTLESTSSNVLNKTIAFVNENKELKKDYTNIYNKYYLSVLEQNKSLHNNKNFIIATLDVKAEELRNLSALAINNKQNIIVALFCNNNDKTSFIVAVSKDLQNSVNLKELSQNLAQQLKTTGGGNNQSIQGLVDTSLLAKAVDIIKNT